MNGEFLDELPDGVVVIGADRAVVFVNRAAERISGWRREEAIGLPYQEVLNLRDAGGLAVHEHADPFDRTLAITTGCPERDLVLRRRDGGDRPVAIRATYRRDDAGRIERVLVSVRDAERRRRIERAGSDLISTVSHEIRSPLTSVKGFTSTLLRKWGRFNDEQKQHMLRTINADADRVTRLLTDLLDVSRLEAGRLELHRQEVDLAEIGAHVAERLSMEAAEHPIETHFAPGLPKVFADPGKLEQVLINIAENALKYADPGPVRISAEVRGGEVVLRIADAGPGIDPRHLQHLFTKFYRRGAGERRPGTGLGLYICKGIIEAHGGQIAVERSGPDGTVFAFTLPLEP